MRKVFFELQTITPFFFEISSETEVPDWFLRRIVKETYSACTRSEKGVIETSLGRRDLPLNYFVKGQLVHIFVPETQELDWKQALESFSAFYKEGKLIPYNLEFTVARESDDPESIFEELSNELKDLLERSLIDPVDAEISYVGDLFKINLSLPLDKDSLRRILTLAKRLGWATSAQIAPLEEKIKL